MQEEKYSHCVPLKLASLISDGRKYLLPVGCCGCRCLVGASGCGEVFVQGLSWARAEGGALPLHERLRKVARGPAA